MRIPPSPPRPPAPPSATPPPDRRAAPATLARLVALVAQEPGVSVLLGAGVGAAGTERASLAPAMSVAVPLQRPADGATGAPTAPAAPGAPLALADARDGHAIAARLDAVERLAAAVDARSDGPAPVARGADAMTRVDPATWLPALHAPLLARLHARHPALAASMPHPARPASRSQLRALGAWLAERGEVATGDEELVRLARALRLDRRLVRVAAAALLLSALVFLLV